MPNYLFNTEATDGHIHSQRSTYAAAQTQPNGITATNQNVRVGQIFSNNQFIAYQAFLAFDTSAVLDEEDVSSVTLSLEFYAKNGAPGIVEAYAYDWMMDGLALSDWRTPAQLATMTKVATLDTAGVSANTYHDFVSLPEFAAAINKGGYTGLVLVTSRFREGLAPSGNEYMDWSSGENAALKPRLTVSSAVVEPPPPPPEPVTYTVSDATAVEGEPLNFTITASRAVATDTLLTTSHGSVTLPAGETTVVLSVPTVGNITYGPNATITVVLDAALGGDSAVGTVADDDTAPPPPDPEPEPPPPAVASTSYTPQRINPLAGTGLQDDTDSDALNAFFAHVGSAYEADARITGTYYLTKPLVHQTNNTPEQYTRTITWDARLIAIQPMQTMLTTRKFRASRYNGRCWMQGGLNAARWNRKANVGFVPVDCRSSYFFDDLIVDCVLSDGVRINSDIVSGNVNNNNFVTFGKVSGHSNGSYWDLDNLTTDARGQLANFSANVRTGIGGSGSQASVLTVDALPDVDIPSDQPDSPHIDNMQMCYGVYNGGLYMVRKKNVAASTIEVFPWLPDGVTTGEFRYVYGHGFYSKGPNAGIITLEGGEYQHCGIGLGQNSLYGGVAKSIGAQHCTIGWTFGGGWSGGSKANQVTGLYLENTFFDIVQTSAASSVQATLIGPYEIGIGTDRLIRSWNISAPREPGNPGTFRKENRKFNKLQILGEKLYIDAGVHPEGFFQSTNILSMEARAVSEYVFKTNQATFQLTPDRSLNRLFGNSAIKIIAVGATGPAPTSNLTVTSNGGFTVNGTTSAVFSGFTGPAQLVAYCDFVANNWIVGRVG